ncbi:helix-turn-helix transcriptional regulator [Thalassospira alkalitolerans]|uniref:AraC family transcriptional regulator n=1 Tax=Thalassospira alkalitolerans TaxID=1293890 RepID=UPI003AA8CD09
MPEQSNHSFFTVNDLPMSKRYDVWQDSIDCIFQVDALPEVRKEEFTASLDAHLVGSMMLARTISKHQFWSRTASNIAADGMDHYMVQFYYDGGMASDDGKNGTEIESGGLLVQDLTQVASATTSDFDNLVLVLPRPILENKLILPEDHNMRFLSTKDPMVRILADQLVSIKKNASSVTVEQSTILETVISEMLSCCLNTAMGENSETRQQRKNVQTMVAIRRYFRKNFSSPDLNPARAAQDLGLSRSRLYTLMEDHGGVHSYVRNLRLRHALSILSNPATQHRPLYDIALECGFASDSSFIRAFREKFDMTPGDVRQGALPANKSAPHTSTSIDTRYENWLNTM